MWLHRIENLNVTGSYDNEENINGKLDNRSDEYVWIYRDFSFDRMEDL